MDIAAVLIALAALIFTIWSFRRQHVRPGELKVYRAASFGSGYGSNLVLYLPLIVHNTGPTTMAVLDVRVWFDHDEESPFVWQAYDRKLPGRDQERHMSRPLVVPSRGAIEWVFEFQHPALPDLQKDQEYQHEFRVEMRAAGLRERPESEWWEVARFPLTGVIWGAAVPRRSGDADANTF